jgi:chromosome segregation ATPase
MSKTITRTKNISGFQDVREDNSNEDDQYITMMLTEIDELNNKLNEERLKNEQNDTYIQVLEEEIKRIYENYKKVKDDIKLLENYKEISKMTNDNIKKQLKKKYQHLKRINMKL